MKSRNNFKNWAPRTISATLALIMVLGMLPYAVFAAGKSAEPVAWKLNGTAKTLSLDDFGNIGGEITATPSGVTLSNTGGDHWAIYKGEATNQFRLEADVTLADGGASAALVFGALSATDVSGWGGANFDLNNADNAIRVFQNGDHSSSPKGDIDFNSTLHMALEVMADGSYTYALSDQSSHRVVQESNLIDWGPGGHVGLLTFHSEATFSNIILISDPQPYTETIPDWKLEGKGTVLDLNQFADRSGGTITVTGTGSDQKMIVDHLNGDHFIVYTGLEKKTNQFRLEADVEPGNQDAISAALIFGLASKRTPSTKWGAANFDLNNSSKTIRVFRDGQEYGGKPKGDLDFSKSVHMGIEVMADGSFVYRVTQGDVVAAKAGTLKDWDGGYIGLLTFNSAINFSNVIFLNDTQIKPVEKISIDNPSTFHSNLDGLSLINGSIGNSDEGLRMIANTGDAFLESETASSGNFVYRATVKFNETKGAASLMFRSSLNQNGDRSAYIANIDGKSGACRLFTFYEGTAFDIAKCENAVLSENGTYELSVTVNGVHITYSVNGKVVGMSGDFTDAAVRENPQFAQNEPMMQGTFGLLTWNTDVTYQNVTVTPLSDGEIPALTDITVTANGGRMESQPTFTTGSYVSVVYTSYETQSVSLEPKAASGAVCTVDGNTALKDGVNKFAITVTKGNAAQLYRVIVYRRAKAGSDYYNEPYRGQYHYSVQEGWGNDPNGMVYFNGVYHLFYQFYYGAAEWGAMHWMHATSTDLLHWQDQPITFYPDEYGTAFSGCAVVDDTNVSGLFSSSKGGIVGFITRDGNGERVLTIYSEDGMTWKQADGVTLNWMDDPLTNAAFRDPHVFQYEDTWFMVIAGGPLRIYSSKNLRDWKCESTYADLHTECPALYHLPVDGTNEYKWVLNRGGRAYKIGNFAPDSNGNWTFVPDTQYAEADGIMSFGKDYYATMAYYNGVYSDEQQPVITVSWMATWEDDMCNRASSINSLFNGTYCLQLELSVKKMGNQYYLVQTPISQYRQLEQTTSSVTKDNTLTSANERIDLGAVGSSYRMDAHLDAANAGSVTFALRVDHNEATLITYDYASDKLTLDRSNSGKMIEGTSFGQPMESTGMAAGVKNEDGSVDLHIYVDRMSVEVFNGDYTVSAAAQLYPTNGINANGAYVKAEGLNAAVDVRTTVTQLDSIHTNHEPTPVRYIDVPGHSAEQAILFISSRGIFQGIGQNRFAPDEPMNRAMLATALYRLAGQPASDTASFSDVAIGTWYSEAVSWVSNQGIMGGTSSSSFEPNGNVTFEQLSTALCNYVEIQGGDASVMETPSNPAKFVTRGDVAQALMIMINNL